MWPICLIWWLPENQTRAVGQKLQCSSVSWVHFLVTVLDIAISNVALLLKRKLKLKELIHSYRVFWKSQAEQVSRWNVLLPLKGASPASLLPMYLHLCMLLSLPDCSANQLNALMWQKTIQLFLLCQFSMPCW